jgi:hypothetical protein
MKIIQWVFVALGGKFLRFALDEEAAEATKT